jgi:hypothetical protein
MRSDSSRLSPFPWDDHSSVYIIKADKRKGNEKCNDKATDSYSIITRVLEDNRWENINHNDNREECESLEVIITRTGWEVVESSIRKQYKPLSNRDKDYENNMEEGLEVTLVNLEYPATITSDTTTLTTELSMTTLESSPEILRQVILGNFLTVKEMGRLLLLVSKSATSMCFLCDDVWNLLLVNRFGADIAFQMMESFNCGPRACFRHLIKVEPVKQISLRFVPSDYRVIINVYDDIGNRVVFKILNGEKLVDFFNHGFVELKGPDGLRKPVYTKYSGLFRMKATVHIVRVPDQKSICIIDERKGLNEYSLEKRYFTFTTTTCPSSMRLWDDDYMHNIYFNLHMKIRKTKPKEKCGDGCNVALYGSIRLEALCYPTCEIYRDYRDRNGGQNFSELLEMLYGWS